MLPRVIAGTSAGGLIAALVCTHTDEELKTLLVPELAHKLTACEEPLEVWFKRFWKTGARFDSVTWARKVRHPQIRRHLSFLIHITTLECILHEGLDDLS